MPPVLGQTGSTAMMLSPLSQASWIASMIAFRKSRPGGSSDTSQPGHDPARPGVSLMFRGIALVLG